MLLKRKYEQNKDHSFSQFVNIKAKGVMKMNIIVYCGASKGNKKNTKIVQFN